MFEGGSTQLLHLRKSAATKVGLQKPEAGSLSLHTTTVQA